MNFRESNLTGNDWFVVCNPDIIADGEKIAELVGQAEADGEKLVCPLLWNDVARKYDDNIRPFPQFGTLALSLIGFSGPSRYSDQMATTSGYRDWASGAFLAIRADLYQYLNGFDERYFMYMEDVDFCRRARLTGHRLRSYTDIEFVHNAARANRQIISKNFAYHLTSAARYLVRNYAA
ncbi:hypothetical protein GRI69_04405 [Erythrobacter vulgaris]|uniref:Glycosyltransferase n=1 Tax=Qipengyuania vulgaris TaxID=291985 RepID=A0A844XQG8_9SPHN|nr:glycosyltransferase family 2 protein [Qipengyuania vulgaris]MXO47497.1 hypothetical protein [Qipengyuania vulgaris]